MAKSKAKAMPLERDDDVSEPYSDELDVSSPEMLEMGDEGEVVKNTNWKKGGKKANKEKSESVGIELNEAICKIMTITR